MRWHLIVREKRDISDNTASLFSGPLCSHDRIPIRTPRLENTYLQREQERDQHTTQQQACLCKQPLVIFCPSYWACSVQRSVSWRKRTSYTRLTPVNQEYLFYRSGVNEFALGYNGYLSLQTHLMSDRFVFRISFSQLNQFVLQMYLPVWNTVFLPRSHYNSILKGITFLNTFLFNNFPFSK